MYATGITPAMVTPKVGSGTQYIAGMRDSKGNPLDGSKTYKVHLPPNAPAKGFWAFTIYNVQTRSMLQTDQRFPEITSAEKSVKQNTDGSSDVYFGPAAPKGMESNWIQTVPSMGWHMLFRLYGPEKAWFEKTYQLRVPAKPPVKRFWAVTAYDPISRSLLDSGGNINVGSMGKPEVNSDGSVDIYFGQKAPEGKEKNFIKTDLDKGFFVVFRFYGPLDGYIKKTWVLNDFELVK